MTLFAHNQLCTDDSTYGSVVAPTSMMVEFMRRHMVKMGFCIDEEEDQFAVAVTRIAGDEDKLEGKPQEQEHFQYDLMHRVSVIQCVHTSPHFLVSRHQLF